MKYFFLPLVLVCFAAAASAQTFVTPRAGTVRVRDIQDKYNAQVYSLEAPAPDGKHQERRALKAEVERRFPRRRALPAANAKKTASAPQPVIIRAFVPDSSAAIPPDNYMAVSRAGIGINVHNSMLSIVNANTGVILRRVSMYDFTLSLGLGVKPFGGDYYRYDPKVMYDPEADRFFFVCLAGINSNSHIIVGFSQTNDPEGDWNLYAFVGDNAADGTWFDYPTIALTHDEVFLSGNKLVYNGSFQTGFVRSVIYQIRKADGYAGAPLTSRIWDNVNYGGKPIRNIFPVKGGGGLQGPAQYFLSVRNMDLQNDSVFLLKISDTLRSPSITLSVAAMKSNLSYGFPPNGLQPDSGIKLQTNDGRVLGAFAEGNEIQFVTTSVYPATGASAIYHGIMSGYTGASPSVQAAFITVDTMDFGYPNLSFAGMNGPSVSSIISFDYTGRRQYPGVAAVYWDGSAHSDLLLVKTGDSSINMLRDTLQRWGDYTGSQPRWNGIGEVWTVGLFGRRDNTYGDWMALLRSPNFTSVPAPPSASSPAALYPNPGFRYVRLRFSLPEKSQLRFSIVNTAGQLVDEVTSAKCRAGINEIEFNIASLPPGHYILHGMAENGRTLVSKSFLKE
jgi:hypothetical protein